MLERTPRRGPQVARAILLRAFSNTFCTSYWEIGAEDLALTTERSPWQYASSAYFLRVFFCPIDCSIGGPRTVRLFGLHPSATRFYLYGAMRSFRLSRRVATSSY